eukprot:COSAG06_NODE_5231_length_3624_cov_3.016738_2_plen_124_part_00
MYHASGRQHAAEAGGRRRAGTGGQPACCPGRCAYVQLYALPITYRYGNYVRFRVWNTSSFVILTADYINTAVFCNYMQLQAPYSRLNFVLSCRSSRHAVHLCVAAQQQHASAAARGERALPAP